MRRWRKYYWVSNYPHAYIYITALIFFACAITNYHTITLIKNEYKEVEGTVIDVETENDADGQEERYSYSVLWQEGTTYYEYFFSGENDSIEEGSRMVWVHPENTEVIPFGADKYLSTATIYSILFIICIVAVLLINRKTSKRAIGSLDTRRIYFKDIIAGNLSMLLFAIAMIIVLNIMDADILSQELTRSMMYNEHQIIMMSGQPALRRLSNDIKIVAQIGAIISLVRLIYGISKTMDLNNIEHAEKSE